MVFHIISINRFKLKWYNLRFYLTAWVIDGSHIVFTIRHRDPSMTHAICVSNFNLKKKCNLNLKSVWKSSLKISLLISFCSFRSLKSSFLCFSSMKCKVDQLFFHKELSLLHPSSTKICYLWLSFDSELLYVWFFIAKEFIFGFASIVGRFYSLSEFYSSRFCQ